MFALLYRAGEVPREEDIAVGAEGEQGHGQPTEGEDSLDDVEGVDRAHDRNVGMKEREPSWQRDQGPQDSIEQDIPPQLLVAKKLNFSFF